MAQLTWRFKKIEQNSVLVSLKVNWKQFVIVLGTSLKGCRFIFLWNLVEDNDLYIVLVKVQEELVESENIIDAKYNIRLLMALRSVLLVQVLQGNFLHPHFRWRLHHNLFPSSVIFLLYWFTAVEHAVACSSFGSCVRFSSGFFLTCKTIFRIIWKRTLDI